MVVVGLIKRPRDFPSFLLGPFIANLFLYLLYYIVMKVGSLPSESSKHINY